MVWLRSRTLRSGFSFVELAAALALVSIVAFIGSVTFSYVRDDAEGFAAGPLLSSAQLEGRRLRSSEGTFPSDLLAGLNAVSGEAIVYSAGAVTGASSVSVLVEDDVTVLYAVSSAADCLVLVDRPFGSSTWALLRQAGPSCDASVLASTVLALQASGSLAEPQVVDL